MAIWRKHVIAFTGMMLGCTWQLCAQSDAVLSQYFMSPVYYNAGAAGATEQLNINAAAQLQRSDDTKQKHAHIEADMPIAIGDTRSLGAGILASYNGIGNYRLLNASLPVSWKIGTRAGSISLGIAPGVRDFKTDKTSTEKIHKTQFDFAAGIWYGSEVFRAGISAAHIGRKHEAAYFCMAEGNIGIKSASIELKPSVIALRSDGKYGGQATLRAAWRKLLWGGVGYRLHESAVVLMGVDIQGFRLAYSYMLPSDPLHGGHAVSAGYSVRFDAPDRNRHRHKSVRIM